jgi:hypothetical protein
LSINYGVNGRTKDGVDYNIKSNLVTFSATGMNSLHEPNEVKILMFEDLKEPLVTHYIAQTGEPTNGVTVRLTEAEANLFAESLNVEIKKI